MKRHFFVLSLAVSGAISASAQIDLNGVPERAVGTPRLTVTSNSPNLVAGREFYAPQAVALDNSVSPPRIYVSDYANNRVLAWKNAAAFTNGQTADLAIGQPDLVTTFAEGPSVAASEASSGQVSIAMPTTGLNSPSGIAVDANGNLYVSDGGNNRVLRYPHPFAQTGQYPIPDLAIGQAGLSGYLPNYPGNTATPTAQGLFFFSGSGTPQVAPLAFDSSGDLWVVDPGNARIVEFTAASLAGTGGGITASVELGQPSLTSNYAAALSTSSATSIFNVSQFFDPSALAFDPSGNLYVGDTNPACTALPCGRVMVFAGPKFATGMSASTNMYGVPSSTYTYPASGSQPVVDSSFLYGPVAIFFPTGGGGQVGVVDALWNRIMLFPSFANFPTNGSAPVATTILGQPNPCTQIAQFATQSCKAPNNGSLTGPSNSVFNTPGGAAYSGTDLYLVDAGNNRVLDLPQSGATFGSATRVLGQDYMNTDSANLIEGREFDFRGAVNGQNYIDAGIALDNSTGTPHLYVADPYNNRVLGFKDVRTFQNGVPNTADVVLGQANFTTAIANYPNGTSTPTQTGLYRPIGLAVDAQGNLYVADSLNGRVVRFPSPFTYTGGGAEPADLVLGQQSFTSTVTDTSSTNMAVPYGLAFTPSCNPLTPPCTPPNGLLVSDQADNRVLYFPTTNGTFVPGANNVAATIVFGQSSFTAHASSAASTGMNSPHHISCDTSGYVYVADTGNNRVLIFPDPHSALTPPAGEGASATIPNLAEPESVYVNPVTGEIWVTDTFGAISLRYASYNQVSLGYGSISGIVDASGNFTYHPLAAIQDQYGDLFVADDAHRVAAYYPGVNLCNGASFLPSSPTSSQYPSANCLPAYNSELISAGTFLPERYLAPGVIGTIFPCENCANTQFLTGQNVFSSYPVPTQLGGVEVLVTDANGVARPAPLYIVYPGQINFIVPEMTAASGFADLEVIQVSTGQILGATQMPVAAVAPGAFPYPGGQTGATVFAAAINQNGTINSASNPANLGDVISIYMTGEGYVPGEPADGVPATAAVASPYPIAVLMNDLNVDTDYGENFEHIQYSGINQYPGMWQINVQIPKTVVAGSGACPTAPGSTGNEVCFAVIVNGTANWDITTPFKTFLYIK